MSTHIAGIDWAGDAASPEDACVYSWRDSGFKTEPHHYVCEPGNAGDVEVYAAPEGFTVTPAMKDDPEVAIAAVAALTFVGEYRCTANLASGDYSE